MVTLYPPGFEQTQPKQLIIIGEDEFNKMKENLDDMGIDRELLGLDDIMLKKMLLAYSTGKYSHNADIIIQLTDEEGIKCVNYANLADPFDVKKGSEIDQISMNLVEKFKNTLGQVFDLEKMQNSNIDKQNNYYLCAKGILKFVNEDNEELVYYNEDVLKQLYSSEFQANRYGAKSGYAESVWNYLSSKCYTDGENGIKIYSYEKVEENLIEWQFNDVDAKLNTMKDFFNYIGDLGDNALSNITINRQIIPEDYLYTAAEWQGDISEINGGVAEFLKQHGIVDTAKKTYAFQDIDYYSQISKYTTPVELLINLLNVSSSREFVDDFIEKVTTYNEKDNYITVKFYRKSKSTSEEKTEVTNEKTLVSAEALLDVQIAEAWFDGSGGKHSGSELAKSMKLTHKWVLNDKGEDALYIEVTGIPNGSDLNYERLTVKVTHKNGEGETFEETTTIPYGKWLEGDPLGTTGSTTVRLGIFDNIDRYKNRENEAIITRYTTKLTTETKLDVAVEKVKVWYGTTEYENTIQKDVTFETKDSDGKWIDAEVEKKTQKVDGKDAEVDVGKPLMLNKTKADITHKNIAGKEDIFTSKSIEGFAVNEVVSRVEKWYANLKADEVLFWVTPGGHLTHALYTRYGDGGLQLCDENELLNIRFTYAMENGAADWWFNKVYTPYSVTFSAKKCDDSTCINKGHINCVNIAGPTGYQVGYLKEIVDRYMVTKIPQDNETEPNANVFLNLLKDESGNEKEYADVNGGTVNIANRFFYHGGAELLFDLLERSPNTQGLVHVMKYILGQYKEGINYGVTEWTFEIFNRENMLDINSST